MNTCVSDDMVIINIQGIRYVNWGESTNINSQNPGRHHFVTVTYKGNHQTFYYKTAEEAKGLFDKIRDVMDKSRLRALKLK